MSNKLFEDIFKLTDAAQNATYAAYEGAVENARKHVKDNHTPSILGLGNVSVINEKPAPTMLSCTQKLVAKLRKQMGDFMFPRYCRNLGIDFEDTYFMMFGRMPRK